MNKAQLIEALSERLGDKKVAAGAVDSLVDVIVRTVNKGEKVNITGFGVFEKRARAARIARNPRTGETVKVKKTNVPAFRPGTNFREVISGAKKLPRVTASKVAGTTSRTTSSRPASSTRTTTRPSTTRAAATTTTRTRAAAAAKPATRPSTRTAAAPSAATTTKKTAAKPATSSKKAASATSKKAAAKASNKKSSKK
ncbi:MAG TPA: HU family DNA-binding protein [Pseudonocardiaceae bacterium]